MKQIIYTGIGSREAPDGALLNGYEIAKMMAVAGATLRSGSADGMDRAFEDGARHHHGDMEIFLPWPLFNGSDSKFTKPSDQAEAMASTFHPNWWQLSNGAQKLHGRNTHQVLGWLLNQPSDFVVCWTKDGAEKGYECTSRTGGTATAIRIAWAKCVPVFNLQRPDAYERMFKHLEQLTNG